MLRILLAGLLLSCLLACEGKIPLSRVDGPFVPDGAQILPVTLQLPGGRLSSGMAGDNAPVSGGNIKAAGEELLGVMFSILQRARAIDSVPGTMEPGERVVDNGSSVLSGIFSSELGEEGGYSFSGQYTAELKDWSAGGGQYFGGGMAVEMTYFIQERVEDVFGFQAKLSGRLELGGKYRGTVSFRDFFVQQSAWISHYRGKVQVDVGGSRTVYYLEKYCSYGSSDGCRWISPA